MTIHLWMYDDEFDSHIIDWHRIESDKRIIAIKPETVISLVNACMSISDDERNKIKAAMRAIIVKNAYYLLRNNPNQTRYL